MSAKPRLLLPDTVVIITAMACGRWQALCDAYDVIVPSIIAFDEMQFFIDKSGRKQYVELVDATMAGRHRFVLKPSVSATGGATVASLDLIGGGEFTVWPAPLAELQETRAMLHPELRPRVDAGELEAITYLRLIPEGDGVAFVTADVGAIYATVAFDRAECAMSLEDVLAKCGKSTPLDFEFGAEHMKQSVSEGMTRKLQGRALAAGTPSVFSRPPRRRSGG
jgi:hypothetical protein